MKLFSGRARWRIPFLPLFLMLIGPSALPAQEPEAGTPLEVVHELYDLVTFPAGTVPDWDNLRSMFIPDAVVILRTAPDSTSVFDVEGFVQDWLRFIEGYNVMETGFSERITRTHTTVYGDIAHIWFRYESVLNEIVLPNRPIPDLLRGGGAAKE
jgi:hypothetical protein